MELCLSSIYLSHPGAVSRHGIWLLPWQQTRSKQGKSPVRHLTIISKSNESKMDQRRSADYHPSIWEPSLIESLSSPFTFESCANQLEELKRETKKSLKFTKDNFDRLKLVASIQRLGVAYHFEEEIKEALNLAYTNAPDDLYATALRFRLLREHGYPITSEVFNKFRGRDGRFMESLERDAVGLLSLYEASHLGMHGEDDLEEAKNFSIKHLKSLMKTSKSSSLAEQVKYSLDIPLHWRMPRLEARNFINVYNNDDTKSTVLLELAKLDYNIVQSVHQREVAELSGWWRNLGFKEKLSFSRDRLMENYLWALGITWEPQFSNCRIGLTKFICILTAIDDIYDIYGSLYELEHFTNAVERWDLKALDDLPEYMKIGYLAMFNFGNEIAYNVLKDQGLNILPIIKNLWANLCRSYIVEARWYNKNYTPTVDEYLGNAWVSVGGPSVLAQAYILQCCITKENSLHSLNDASKWFYWPSLITRLSDDLGTSEAEMMRGDVPKSIQCYMNKEDISKEEAQTRVKDLISYSWKKLNEDIATKSLPKSMVNISLNIARTAQCIFQHGDGIGSSMGVTEDRLISLIIKPIPI